MTKLPDKAEAEATLRQSGYVRVGDHSATTQEALDEIYSTRDQAWHKAITKLEMNPGQTPSDEVKALRDRLAALEAMVAATAATPVTPPAK
jgi:hypothetical protein